MSSETELNAILLEVAEREQRLLAEQFHDTLCPSLVGISLLTKVLLRRLEAGKPIDIVDLAKIVEFLDEAIDDARTPFRVQSIPASETGLTQALEDLARQTSKRAKCSFICRDEVRISAPRVAQALYRIAQEAVWTSLRQDPSTELMMSLQQDGEGITMRIAGLKEGITSSRARDVPFWRHYAEAVGAKLKVETGGTALACTFRHAGTDRKPAKRQLTD